MNGQAIQATATAFFVLFSIVGLALWGLPYYYDFMVQQFGWTRAQVTSGNALSKLVVGPLFGFAAGWLVDRFGPRRLMMAGILMAGAALIGLRFGPRDRYTASTPKAGQPRCNIRKKFAAITRLKTLLLLPGPQTPRPRNSTRPLAQTHTSSTA